MSIIAEVETESLSDRIKNDRFSKYIRLVRTTARVLAMYQKTPVPHFYNACKHLKPEDINNVEQFWFKQVQKSMKMKLDKGDYKRLCPKTNSERIVVVGGRAEKWFQFRYDA